MCCRKCVKTWRDVFRSLSFKRRKEAIDCFRSDNRRFRGTVRWGVVCVGRIFKQQDITCKFHCGNHCFCLQHIDTSLESCRLSTLTSLSSCSRCMTHLFDPEILYSSSYASRVWNHFLVGIFLTMFLLYSHMGSLHGSEILQGGWQEQVPENVLSDWRTFLTYSPSGKSQENVRTSVRLKSV